MVPQTYEPSDDRDMDALVESQDTRIASQLMTESVEGSHAAFNLGHIVGVGLEICHHHRVVDVGHRNL